MNLEKIWKRELRKRQANEFRRDRTILNWPIHAQRVVDVFQAFEQQARKDGVHMRVVEPEFSPKPEEVGTFITGASSVHLGFGIEYTGEGILDRDVEGYAQHALEIETGSELVVHFSSASGLIQVFFRHPKTDRNKKSKEPILYKYTYNTDTLTHDWIASLIPPFLAFNRCSSVLQRPGLIDVWRMRWWQFYDIRNRRGYLKKFKHIFTAWELLVIGAVISAIVGFPLAAVIKWLS
ncbi:hypothetical protein [Pseudomonas sp. COR18]|uniref:hypothetical protein n=1 Tax=Pseudomonas sp. COR18 TaxID=3399680 RepID=UPI003AFF924E